jgi:hypothetical protein
MTAGSVVAYATKQLRDESCNEIKSSFLHFNTKKRPIRAVTRAEIKSMGHKESLIKTSDVGWIVSTHVIGHNMSMQEYTEMLGN